MKGSQILIFLTIMSIVIKEDALPYYAAIQFDPSLKWQMIETGVLLI